jgi:hypothetical protein
LWRSVQQVALVPGERPPGFLLLKWRRRLQVSLSLLWVPSWNRYPVAHRLRVKTRSSSWTSDDSIYGCRDLLGGVVARDTFARWIDLLLVVALAGGGLSIVGKAKRGLSPLSMVSTFGWWPRVFFRLWFVRSQHPTESRDARHSPVRCGTSLKGGACGNDFL